MKNKNYSRAKVLTMIPIIVLVILVICIILANILEVPTSKGFLYTIFAIGGLVGAFLSPLPCLIISIFGTVFASKAKKEGILKARKYFVLGIIEIIVCAICTFFAAMLYIVGQGV